MAMNQLTIALLQMTSGGLDREANKVKGEAFCRRAQAMGADIALFPEMWSIGYQFYVPSDQLTPADDVWRAGAMDARGCRQVGAARAHRAVAGPGYHAG